MDYGKGHDDPEQLLNLLREQRRFVHRMDGKGRDESDRSDPEYSLLSPD
jgi:hypothetical protein